MISQSIQQRLAALPNVCVAITGSTPEQMQSTAAALLPDFPFQELRLDYLDDPAAGIRSLAGFVRENSSAAFLGTCRPVLSGGRLQGSAQDELRLLCAAADAGFSLVDLSLESAETLGTSALEELRSRRAAVVVSFHDFHATGDLDAILARMRPLQPDLYKIVPTATNLRDSLTLLGFLDEVRKVQNLPVVAIAMGEPGVPTRVLGPRFGSLFTFGASNAAEATAPGQLTAQTLAQLYRIQKITPATKVFGVAGDPIHSSLSPLMLNTAFREADLDAVYLPLKTSSAEELFAAASELPLQGFSVTMPLKQTVLPLLDHVAPLAQRIGAVNTVHRTPEGHLHGDNTDAAGIVVPLERRLQLRNARILVLGAGGAARAAVFACLDRGAHVFIQNRTREAAQRLADESGATAIPRAALTSEYFDVLINATPAGMRNHPLPLPVAEDELNAGLVFDLVYNPIDTPLLALARSLGIPVIPGVEMFIQQGARQFEIWTGKPAPVDAMQHAVLAALLSRS